MTESRRARLPVKPPAVGAPPLFVERRTASRRSADRLVMDETRLLAQALDILAADRTAEERLAGLLDLLARTVGARRAAVLATGLERRIAVSLGDGEDPTDAEALAGWLDADAPRTRAERAAALQAPISFAVLVPDAGVVDEPSDRDDVPDKISPVDEAGPDAGRVAADPGAPPAFARLAIPGNGAVVLGFDFADADDADAVGERLPPNLARHAAAALALATEQLARERELALLRAHDAERVEFVSTVAHELRTPLTGLNGYLDLILSGRTDDPEVERDFLERSQGIVDSMAELVGDLLELSRLESGTLAIELRPISLREVGERIVERLEPIAMERGIDLRTALPPRLRTATADRRRVEQILTNLTANALKFSPSDGTVELAGWFDGPVALFAVRDDGAGIGTDDRVRIFDRFYRMSAHERVNGTGLGLPIARELARAMKGELDVASVPGSGSSFVLVLPGPAAVEPEVISFALARALGSEEVRLRDRAVVRASHAADENDAPAVPLPLPRILPDPRARPRSAQDGKRSTGSQNGTGRPVRLRAIDGKAERSDSPTPA